jgi:hypothetical protein
VDLAIETSWGRKGQKHKELDWFSGSFIALMFWSVKGGEGKSPIKGRERRALIIGVCPSVTPEVVCMSDKIVYWSLWWIFIWAESRQNESLANCYR